jgi:hypothetical protein
MTAMSVCKRLHIVCLILTVSTSYSEVLLGQSRSAPVEANRYSYRNSLTVNGGVGLFADYWGWTAFAEYQRYIGKRGKLSVDLRATLSTSTYSYPGHNVENIGRYLAPGVRYHFAGNIHKADISIGIFIPLGSHMYNGSFFREKESVGFLYGVLSEMVLDIRPKGRFTIGGFMHLGLLFSDVRKWTGREVSPFCNSVGLRVGSFW